VSACQQAAAAAVPLHIHILFAHTAPAPAPATHMHLFMLLLSYSYHLPNAMQCSLPSAYMDTGEPAGRSSGISPPLDVNPGHMMFAPPRTNRIAPLSTCMCGIISGYLCTILNVGNHGPISFSWKNMISPSTTSSCTLSSALPTVRLFFGRSSSMASSNRGYCSVI